MDSRAMARTAGALIGAGLILNLAAAELHQETLCSWLLRPTFHVEHPLGRAAVIAVSAGIAAWLSFHLNDPEKRPVR